MQWLAEICVHRPVFATVIVMFLTVVGGFSFFTLGVDRFPKIDLPTVSVRTTNPGAAPEEIESEITDVIEGALNTVPGVEEMRSSSSRGSSNVTLTFNLEKDPDVAFQEIQQKLSTVINRLPETADPPVAQKADPDSQPILMYTISAPRPVMELSELVENLIQERIESADGVGEVFMWGSRGKQVKIYIDPNRLAAPAPHPRTATGRRAAEPFGHCSSPAGPAGTAASAAASDRSSANPPCGDAADRSP